MAFAIWLHSLLLAAAVVKGTTETVPGATVPGAYIFEFHDGQDASDFYAEANVHATSRLNLTYSLFKGVSLQFNDVDTAQGKVASLSQHASVKAIHPIRSFSGPDARQRPTEFQSARDPAVIKRQQQTQDTHHPHVMTQVDKLKAKGITGKGVRIGVIDTGIDYTHPYLGGCFGEGCLVAYGRDLVGDEFDGSFKFPPKPDDDPMDCWGHGTSIAGILAGRDNSLGFGGAAQDVTLGAYKVNGCTGSIPSDILIAAFNQAYDDGSHIITASIGGPGGWADDFWSSAITRIVDAGVPCTLGASNDGQEGVFYGTSGGAGKRATSVAAFENIVIPATFYQDTYTIDGGSQANYLYVPDAERTAWDNVSLPLWSPYVSNFGSENGCDPYLAGTPDLSDKIVLVRRGECDFSQKADNAAAAGAKFMMLYNQSPGIINIPSITLGDGSPAIVGASLATGEFGTAWVEALRAGSEVIVSMTNPDRASRTVVDFPNPAGGHPWNFTSWGPNYDGTSKPQFGAPGANILELIPVSFGTYDVSSGTSLSTPLVAAIMALIGQVRGTFDPATLESLLSATAAPARWNTGSGAQPYLAPVAQQGAGLVQAFDAAYATILLSVSSLSFNDTDNYADQSFSIKNLGTEAVTYELSNIGAATAYTFSAGPDASPYPMDFPNDLVTEYAELIFSESKVTIPAGGDATIQVKAQPPNLDAARLPVWSGYVALNASDGSSFTLPYQGILGSLRNQTVMVDSTTDSVWMTTTDADSATAVPVPDNHTFVLPPPRTANGTNVTIAAVGFQLAFGSPSLRLWVVPLTPSVAENATEVLGGITTIGQIRAAPQLWQSRDRGSVAWDGQLNDDTYAPEGYYKIVAQALHIFGDENNLDDFDRAESLTFNLVYTEA
ncbi:subtilase [Diaporthe helianthi]|uniref:Subtilase n=1 Tax=Diaporthe helianthi TaxID=158607 RepID=A0A2P5HIZ0_DIAHE|nr:subtilase [Diaporthe helianthi]